MAQSLSGISVTSKVIGTMAGQGTNVQNDIRIGRNIAKSISATEADILYSVKFTSTAASDQISWDLDLHKFTAASGDSPNAFDRANHTYTGYSSNNNTPGTPTDAVGDVLPTASTIMAILYETDATNTGNVVISSSGDPKFGTVTLAGGTGTGITGAHTRSALFMPRADPSNVNITITFADNSDSLTVLVLAKS